jgi:hypothetical protein
MNGGAFGTGFTSRGCARWTALSYGPACLNRRPLLHSVQPTQWEAFLVMEEARSTMAEKLMQNLRVVPAYLTFNDAAENSHSVEEPDEQ